MVKGYIAKKCDEGWELKEYLEKVSWSGDKEGKGQDTIIVLKRI